MDINRAGRTREPTGGTTQAGDGMPIFGAGMRTDTIESPREETTLGMTSAMAGTTDTTADWGSDQYGRSRNGNDGYYSGPGNMRWRGRVDDYVELRIQGNRVRSIERGGAPTYNEQASFSSPLPRADVRVDVKKRDGRGRVSLLEQPSRYNNYTAVIRIDDNKGGADDYEIEMQWR